MKLKAKFQDEDFDFGEVVEANIYYGGDGKFKVVAEPAKGGIITFYLKTLKELNELFEDPEEPKEHWAIGEFGELYEVSGLALNRIEKLKEIGNYFSSEEEAEKAVEKLKAWKRLKDKGFFFDGRTPVYDNTVKIRARVGVPFLTDELSNDLDLLFGGDE